MSITLHEFGGNELLLGYIRFMKCVNKNAEGKTKEGETHAALALEGNATLLCAKRKVNSSTGLLLFLNISYRFLFLFLSPVITYHFFLQVDASTHRKIACGVYPPPRREAAAACWAFYETTMRACWITACQWITQ